MRLVRLAAPAIAICLSAQALAVEDWTPELAFKTRRVSAVQVSPDGKRVAFVVGTAIMEGEKSEWLSHVHVADADGSDAFQLTGGDKSATAPEWSPDGKWIAFISSRGAKDPKEARANVWRIRADGGEAEALTEEKGGVMAVRWSPDGKQIAFLMTDPKSEDEEKADKEKRDARVIDENPRLVRLYVVPVEKDAEGKRPVRKLTSGAMSLGGPALDALGFDWSPDGGEIAFTHQPTPNVDDWPKADVSVVDVASAAVRPLAATRAAETDPFFSPDGKWIAYKASNDPPTWSGRDRVMVVVRQGGTPRGLAPTHDEQPELLGWSADGTRLLVSETHGTVGRLSAVPVDGGAPLDLSAADTMVMSLALNAQRTHVGFTSQSPARAPEAFASGLEPFAPAQVSRVQEVPEAPGRTEVVSWKSPDGRTIEGLLTTPDGRAAGARLPLLVIVHGGPAGVFVRSFTGAPTPYPVAAFASRGYAVLRANVRGSSGYGFAFRHANYKDWGGGDYRDILSGVDALIARGVADPERLGVMGWSYGGYMTSWIVTQTRRFKAASVGAGVTNLMSFAGTADIPSFIPDYFGGEYWNVFDLWRTRSAMFNVKGVSTPTLIQHGEADLRVPVSQGYELYNALKRQGVTTKMVVYPRQPHGIQEPKLMLDAMQRNLDWFERWIPTAR
jgi:dipeptidyl aminopeptidase/acylaminoacyl peptidase